MSPRSRLSILPVQQRRSSLPRALNDSRSQLHATGGAVIVGVGTGRKTETFHRGDIMPGRIYVVYALVAIAFAAGCKGKNERGVVVGQQPKPSSSGPASSEQVAKEMRGNVSCPAKASAERPSAAPVDDVV